MTTDYVPVNMPIPLLDEVDKIVNDGSFGFRSRNEFCVDAVREKVEYYKGNNYQPNKQLQANKERKQ